MGRLVPSLCCPWACKPNPRLPAGSDDGHCAPGLFLFLTPLLKAVHRWELRDGGFITMNVPDLWRPPWTRVIPGLPFITCLWMGYSHAVWGDTFKNFFYWSIVDVQCCIHLCCRAEWFICTCTSIHSFFFFIISHLIKKSTYGYINLLDQTGETDSNRTEAML